MTEPRLMDMWLAATTTHGHFHAGESAVFRVCKGYNFLTDPQADYSDVKVYLIRDGNRQELPLRQHHGDWEVEIENATVGQLRLLAEQNLGSACFSAQTIVENSNHDHHHDDHEATGAEHDGYSVPAPLGLSLEILPAYSTQAHLGERFTVQVWQKGLASSGTKINVTFSTTHQEDYPISQLSDEQGHLTVFLSNRGDYLFIARHHDYVSTYILLKNT